MTKLQSKQNKLTSRRAVAPVIATLLLVAIAVVGGSIQEDISNIIDSASELKDTVVGTVDKYIPEAKEIGSTVKNEIETLF